MALGDIWFEVEAYLLCEGTLNYTGYFACWFPIAEAPLGKQVLVELLVRG